MITGHQYRNGELSALGVHPTKGDVQPFLLGRTLSENDAQELADAYAMEHDRDSDYSGKTYDVDSKTGKTTTVEVPVGAPEHIQRNRQSNQINFLGYTPEEEAIAQRLVDEYFLESESDKTKPIDEEVTI